MKMIHTHQLKKIIGMEKKTHKQPFVVCKKLIQI